MIVAVTDACIFIDLIESESCTAFFKLELEIVTTRQVWHELELEQREHLEIWIESKQLTITSINDNVVKIGNDHNLSQALSIADLSIWVLANKEKGILLTSDGTLRKMAKKHQVETHGLLWVFDQIVKQDLLPVTEASRKLKQIFNQNIHYKSDQKLLKAYEEMVNNWQHK